MFNKRSDYLKRVMVHGFFTFNLGDDLFLKILIERYPHITFYIYANKNYKELFKEYKNLKVFPSNLLFYKSYKFYV